MYSTSGAHVEDADFAKIGAGFERGQDSPAVVGHHLEPPAVHDVHLFSHLA